MNEKATAVNCKLHKWAYQNDRIPIQCQHLQVLVKDAIC